MRRWIGAETAKLWSLPASHLTALGTVVASAVLAIAFGAAGGTGVLDVGLAPVAYGQAGFVVLGVVAVTSEYSGGQIRTTLAAMPRRITQHLAKLVSLALFAVPAAVVTVVAGVVVAGVVVGDEGVLPQFAEALRAVSGAAAYLTLTALLSAAIATVIRRTVPVVAGLLVHYFVIGPLLRDRAGFAAYLPDTAGHSMWLHNGTGALTGSAVVIAWVVLAVAVSTTTFRRRDA
ncbi:hypothetical protein [Lentzea californiensis]|uniref:hypothetical protein n=1 Tax=Lentzea californiensis TaxID=438851 RepID=UPI002166BCDC|nr:hypothetical protein [Lentzea californiensis]MCR3753778.1 ABC-2 family transporter protein [Lentzea californiensis]